MARTEKVCTALIWLSAWTALELLTPLRAAPQEVFSTKDDFADRLELLSGDLDTDLWAGTYIYTANNDGPARLRIRMDSGEAYEVSSQKIEWVSGAQTLELAGNARLKGDAVSVEAERIVYRVRQGTVEFPGPFTLSRKEEGKESTIQGASGQGTIRAGRLQSFKVKKATGALPIRAGSEKIPAGRRLSD